MARMTAVQQMSTNQMILDVIERFIPDDGGFVIADVVALAVAHLQSEEPDLLARWQDEHLRIVLGDAFGSRLRSRRSHFQALAEGKKFGEALDGGPAAIAGWLETRNHVDGRWLKTAEMRSTDCDKLAGSYEADGQKALMQAAFWRQLAKKVGRRTVGDVFTNEQLEDLHQRVTAA